MPFCPRCRIEYRPGFSKCADCDEPLVAELPEVQPESDDQGDYTRDWIPLAQFATQAYAVMVEEGLKSLGIVAKLLSGTGHFGQLGFMGTTFLPIEGVYIILVPEKYVERADQEGEAILGELWKSCRLWEKT